jgi:hypothetical protein
MPPPYPRRLRPTIERSELMKNILRSIFVVTIAGLLVASASIPCEAARRAAGARSFDGVWSVVIYTLYGDCPRSLRYSLLIYGGRVYSQDQSFQAYGAAAASGAIRVTVAQGGQSANGTGPLSGNSGRGWWRTATGQCSGQWTAERHAANY